MTPINLAQKVSTFTAHWSPHIVGSFNGILGQIPILAGFIPVVMGMGGYVTVPGGLVARHTRRRDLEQRSTHLVPRALHGR